ncbi:hypothetical protein SLNSH_14990 [Alsobacter soli]|uniref:Uncharacterized protein n=1 Tax=Alsobacter soli TaxID=2109933 RepID=A0A2T1HRK1_9HYPH|nr:hypothetical protein [Alsobacter soli]PSC04291.1 hypothetical protein SLNSH_14990 [Alsobacter soli]
MTCDDQDKRDPIQGHVDGEEEVDAVLAEFGGDARAAIRALLADLATLAEDREASVSNGYVRGRRVLVLKRQEPARGGTRAGSAQ